MTLEEDGLGGIVVTSIKAGSAAEMCGEISVGDSLISTSGQTFTRETKYGETVVKSGEQRVTINVRGQVC